jgi:phosphoribosylformylglycinamidine synthase
MKKHAADSPFLSHLPDEFEFPMAHAEGRLVTMKAEDAKAYRESGAAAVTYESDVNGSFEQIAGLQDKTGRVFGMMPHPERFLYREDHYDPDWENPAGGSNEPGEEKWGSGYYLFRSLYESVTSSN